LQSPLTHGRPHLVDEAPCGTRPVSPPTSRPGPDHVGGVDHQHAPYRWEAAADCTAAMIGSQSASAARLIVTKSFTPKIDTTPGAAKTASANGLPAASAADEKLMVSGSAMSSSNLSAFGLGLGVGFAVAIRNAS